MPTCKLAWRAPKQLGSRCLPSSNPGLVLISAKRTWADPTRSARGPLVANLAAFWQQISPIVPVLPTVPTHKSCAVYNLAFEAFHGMEEVIGSIPIRSTNLAHLLGANWRQFCVFPNRRTAALLVEVCGHPARLCRCRAWLPELAVNGVHHVRHALRHDLLVNIGGC